MTRCFLFFLYAMLGLFSALPAAAAAACSGRYTLYVVEVGYYYFTENDKEQGLLPDLVREVSRRSGCQLEVAALSFPRLHRMLQEGKVALVAPKDLGNREQDIPADAVPLLRDRWYWIVRRGSGLRSFDDIRDDARAVVGAVAGGSYGPWWNQRLQQLPGKQLEWTATPESALRKVAENRDSATPGSILAYGRLMEKLNLRQRLDFHPEPGQPPIFIGIALPGKELMPQDRALLSRTLRQIRDDGCWEDMVARYVGPQLARQLVYHPAARHRSRGD